MKIGAIIICRYNSSRLPGKILKKINGKSILSHIIQRLQSLEDLQIIVATSIESTDQPIVEYCLENDLDYYRGSLYNVAERFKKAASTFDLDYAIRVNGDNLFIDLQAMKTMIEIAKTGEYDFISNVKNRTFPAGMSIEIVKHTFYERIFQNLDTDYYKEHVTIYLYENENCGEFYFHYNTKCPAAQGLKIAIDTKEDFQNAVEIVSKLKNGLEDYTLNEVVELIIQTDEK